jgi:S1-C subfamily serine protease
VRYKFLAAVLLIGQIIVGAQTGKTSPHPRIASSSETDHLADMISRAKLNIVRIRMHLHDGRTITGTGFFVNTNGLVVTAAHVVDATQYTSPSDSYDAELLLRDREGNADNDFALYPATVLAADNTTDVAILSLNLGANRTEIMRGRVAQIHEGRPKQGAAIFACGYIYPSRSSLATHGIVAISYTPLQDPPAIGPEAARDKYLGDLKVTHGNSGGPVFLSATGDIVGIVRGMATENATLAGNDLPAVGIGQQNDGTWTRGMIMYANGLTEIVPSSQIVTLLRANGVSFRER